MRQLRVKFKRGEISLAEYQTAIDAQIADCIKMQEEALAAMNRQEKVTQLLLEAELSRIIKEEAETKQQLDRRS